MKERSRIKNNRTQPKNKVQERK